MAILRPNQLPAASTPLSPTDLVVVDQGAGGVNAADPQDVVDAAAPVVSQADAEAGVNNNDRMTALRTKQSIASEVGVTIASKAQGDLASSAVQPTRQVVAGSGLTGGGALSADVTLNVGAGTGISVDADTVGLDATTQSRLLISGGTTSQVLQKASSTDYDVAWATVAAATAVSYAPQTLTSGEQLQARANIGLSNVDNTSDANKPVSTATQTALNGKQDLDAMLTALAALTSSNGQFLAFSGADTPVLRTQVGTVSQSGGVPTGAIIERGSNANGQYVRYADGTQICWNEAAASVTTSSVAGQVFASASTTFTFPVAFSSTPQVSPIARPTGAILSWAGHGSTAVSTTQCSVYVAGVTNTVAAFPGYTAVGRWF